MTGIALGAALVGSAALGWAAGPLTVGLCLLGALGWGRRGLWTLALIPCAVLGAWRVQPPDVVGLSTAGTAGWSEGRVASGPLETGTRQRFELDLDGDRGRLCVSAPVVPAITFGDHVAVNGRIVGIGDEDERGAAFLRSRGCGGSVSARELTRIERGDGLRARLDRLRRALTVALQRAVPGDAGALLAGLVTGDDTALTRASQDAFVATGTSHVTAVSGSNLALIAVMLAVGGTILGRPRSGWWQAGTLAALWLYVVMIGLQPPALRAALVASLAMLAPRVGRRPDLVTIGVVVAGAELLIRPADFSTLAYRLSTASAIALVLGLTGRRQEGVTGWVKAGVIATVITQAATAPFLIPLFGRISVYAIPANLIIGPLCAIAFPIALLAGAAGLASASLAAVIAAPAHLPASGVLAIVGWIAGLPGAERSGHGSSAFPTWAWFVAAVVVVTAVSEECRGGIARLALAAPTVDGRPRAVLVGSMAGVAVGLLTALALR